MEWIQSIPETVWTSNGFWTFLAGIATGLIGLVTAVIRNRSSRPSPADRLTGVFDATTQLQEQTAAQLAKERAHSAQLAADLKAEQKARYLAERTNQDLDAKTQLLILARTIQRDPDRAAEMAAELLGAP